MKKIIPITDLQRQAGQILSSPSHSDEPVIITQRGRTAAVIVSAERYIQIEEDLQRRAQLGTLVGENGHWAEHTSDRQSDRLYFEATAPQFVWSGCADLSGC